MKNIFSKKNLKSSTLSFSKKDVGKDLAERIYTSRLIGSNSELVLHGGGNTSVKSKIKNEEGKLVDVIYIKGSGSDLGSIDQSGFPAVKLKPLIELVKMDHISDEEMMTYLKNNLIDHKSPNPSVETLVHAIINEKYIDHTHSTAILKITDRPNGKKICKELFGKDFLIIPYVMPGFLLAKKIYEIYQRNMKIHGMILHKHGIFTFGDNAEESFKRMIKAVTTAENYLKNQKIYKIEKIKKINKRFDSSLIAPLIKSHICQNQNYILNFRCNHDLLDAINSEDIKKFLFKGVVTPDHVIRTKPFPLILNFDKCKNLDALKKKIMQEMMKYKNNYIKYFKKYNNPKKSFQMLDPIPQIILIQNIGMFSVGRNLNEALVNGDVSEQSIKTIISIEEQSKFESITRNDIFDVEYWSLEQAKLNKIKKPLSGNVVIITGGAGTIGFSTAKKFRENGAEVVLIDKDEQKLKNIPENKLYDFYRCDVTNRSDFKKVINDITKTYGGINTVISNAGSAYQSPIADISDSEIKKSFEINFFSHQIVASECVKLMKEQNLGGCLLFNISKQSVNPGKNFGAYGTSKAALLALCKQYALEYGKYGIRSNGVNADRIKSGLLTDKLIDERARARGVSIENYMNSNLLGKQVLPEDIADAFFHLSISKKTTASILTVDGGNIEASLR
tara:strand:+ start:138 stop:2162 length:2025 start_codon:yes stop_codon:yes gene_type:complete